MTGTDASRRAVGAVTAGAAVAYAAFIGTSGFSVGGRTYFSLFDDAMISMRYAHNLADGHGLVWNPGQRVEGFTNPLWTLVMAGVHWLPIPLRFTSLAVMFISAALLLLQLPVTAALARRIVPGRPRIQLAAVIGVAAYYPLVFWSLRGMEVGLLSALLSTALLLVARLHEGERGRDVVALAVVLSLALATRLDAAIPVAILVIAAGRMTTGVRWRTFAVLGVVTGGVLVGTELARHAYYHAWLPNTYYLKVQGISTTTRLHGGVDMIVRLVAVEALPLVLLVGAGIWFARRTWSPLVVTCIGLLGAQVAYAVYVGGDAWESLDFSDRYITTMTVPAFLLIAAGLAGLADVPARVLAVLGGATLVLLALDLVVTRARYAKGPSVHARATWLVHRSASSILVIAAVIAVAGVVLALAGSRSSGGASERVALAGAAVLTVLTLVQPVWSWVHRDDVTFLFDKRETRVGVALAAAAPPGTTVALSFAGAPAYFSQLPALDMLGKMDPVIAHEPSHPVPFRPGHTKWDYAYVARQHPDVILDLYMATAADKAAFTAAGYTTLPNGLRARTDVGLDLTRLAAVPLGG